MITNILIVGVGGQGTLLSSKIMGAVFTGCGYDVRVGEVHGMSQRGGSVVTYVRYGENVCSPLICEGEADMIISFEQLEAARWLSYLKRGGVVITNTQKLDPMPVISGKAVYPDNVIEKIESLGVSICQADAMSAAVAAGSPKAVNMVLLGMAAKRLPVDKDVWLQAIKAAVPPKTIDINITAFESGWAE